MQATYHWVLDKVELPEKLRPLYNHSAGLKTDFFWAPIMKWGFGVCWLGGYGQTCGKVQHGSVHCVNGYRVYLVKILACIIPPNWSLLLISLLGEQEPLSSSIFGDTTKS